jgi:aspartyl-tRNA(Asn)/glutamyl-tRNA(Gln) amidotransferase subunit C
MSSSRITLADVRHVAKLAALALNEAEELRMQAELDAILGHMDTLNELDVSGVAPTFHAGVMQTALRKDQLAPCLPRAEALRAAPATEAGGFAVPKVLDPEG